MNEIDSISKRISKIRQDFCDGKNTVFAERIGKDASYASQICGGAKVPGRGVLEEILTVFPEVSRPWLYFGEGRMLVADAEKSLLAKEDAPAYEKTLPLIPYDAFAGLPAVDNIGIAFKDCEQYYIPDFISRGADFLIRVSGDSMVPQYLNGDLLACTLIKDVLFFQWGKIYVIDTSQGVLVKRIMRIEGDDEHVLLVSENKDKYEPFKFPTSDIRSLAIVVGLIRAE
ncbi:MAG: helix-turn-helix transcriptional regulator [Bacteroidales bacterium]|jgi:hypothetical protein|nr:helix-turn-helix transcriptional regulator [Bacteroidales bacterium]